MPAEREGGVKFAQWEEEDDGLHDGLHGLDTQIEDVQPVPAYLYTNQNQQILIYFKRTWLFFLYAAVLWQFCIWWH